MVCVNGTKIFLMILNVWRIYYSNMWFNTRISITKNIFVASWIKFSQGNHNFMINNKRSAEKNILLIFIDRLIMYRAMNSLHMFACRLVKLFVCAWTSRILLSCNCNFERQFKNFLIDTACSRPPSSLFSFKSPENSM